MHEAVLISEDSIELVRETHLERKGEEFLGNDFSVPLYYVKTPENEYDVVLHGDDFKRLYKFKYQDVSNDFTEVLPQTKNEFEIQESDDTTTS